MLVNSKCEDFFTILQFNNLVANGGNCFATNNIANFIDFIVWSCRTTPGISGATLPRPIACNG